MIDDPFPDNWQDLQSGVQRIFRNVGLSAGTEVDLATPRGEVNVDVFATDPRSVDKVKYIVECKNWNAPVPQSVVHSFTTVMHETGANIGFIISKHGLQKGAVQYTKSTNITGMTYLEFQQRYFEAWWKRYFCPLIGDSADITHQYTEEFNSVRDQNYEKLDTNRKARFDALRKRHATAIAVFSMFNYGVLSPHLSTATLLKLPEDLLDFKTRVLSVAIPYIEWHCTTFRQLLELILEFLSDIKMQFDLIFGGSIFEARNAVSNVTIEGPALDDDIYHR